MQVELNINGRLHRVDADETTSLLTMLREDIGLTGTRYGCGQGECGACYVLLDGAPVPSCRVSVGEATGKSIVTVEGLAHDGVLHPVQQAFIDSDAMQCGACTSGMLISAVALLARSPTPDEPEIRAAMAPHLCRCGVYGRVIMAIQQAAR